ncbi:hypothetical protein K440DRAFT_670449 [Wilcoxina mikolae CBS 423.85]|nr:hypothetical protein K440DRAFT_670449 [Wilcoxina mikolae CBS 423.85]
MSYLTPNPSVKSVRPSRLFDEDLNKQPPPNPSITPSSMIISRRSWVVFVAILVTAFLPAVDGFLVNTNELNSIVKDALRKLPEIITLGAAHLEVVSKNTASRLQGVISHAKYELSGVVSQGTNELDLLSANTASRLEGVVSHAKKELSNVVLQGTRDLHILVASVESQVHRILSVAEHQLDVAFLNAIISVYLLVFLVGLVWYALIWKAMGKSIERREEGLMNWLAARLEDKSAANKRGRRD